MTDLALVATGALSPTSGSSPHRVHVAGPADSTSTTVSSTTVPATVTTAPATTTTSAPTARNPDPATVAAASSGPAAGSSTGTCPAAACVTLDATRGIGPANHAAAGLNLLPSSFTDTTRMRSLATTMYRSTVPVASSTTFDWTSWDAATNAGARTTLILSDLWAQQFPGSAPATPWSNWTRYTDWVRSTVSHVVLSGRRVDYWDIYNEPGFYDYYSKADFQAETPNDLLQQFLVTYQAIRSVDPTAAIIGPSLGAMYFSPVPPNGTTHEPDMTTFLDFAAAHGLQLAAVAWHANGESPPNIYADAERVWALIHSLPGLGHPQMFLDEYGSIRTQPLPGWDVGYLSAITDAGIGSAVRSCWDSCTLATLDGLLIDGGRATSSEYWTAATYASMTGEMVATSSTDAWVPAVASRAAGGGQVVALIGRMASCAVESWCRTNWWPGQSPAGPEPVQIRVLLPWTGSTVHIDLSYEPFEPGVASPGPITVAPTDPVLTPVDGGEEALTFSIPAFADGSAYNLTVSKS